MPRIARPTAPPLEIVPLGEVDAKLIRALEAELGACLGLQCRAGAALPLDEAWRAPNGADAWSSAAILTALLDGVKGWVLGIADVALWAADVGPVYGEAALAGRGAVIGLAPLRAGSGADADVLRGRLLTEALHELGHVAGAGHCARGSCVMYPSLDIADTDRKGASFCPDCARGLRRRGLRKA